jgi:hypothetical protein
MEGTISLGVKKRQLTSKRCSLKKGGKGPWVTDPALAHGRSHNLVNDRPFRRISLSLPLGRVIAAVFTILGLVFKIMAEHN